MTHLELGKLGFYWRMTDAPNVPRNPVPDFVDFSFSFLEDSQLIIQTRDSQIFRHLETVYNENYNVGYLQEGHALAEPYGGDFIACIENALRQHNPEARRITEIGAGGCYILKKLKELGYETTAVDPSPVAIQKGEEFGIDVVPEFYPAKAAMPRSDLIIHYDVLEHVDPPSEFLKHHLADLNVGGLIVFSVPDCSPYIAFGDISMILHEHLNYFDEESLRNTVEAAGFEVLKIFRGGHGGVLNCVARAAAGVELYEPKSGTSKFDAWIERVQHLRGLVGDFIERGITPGHTLGCYVPLRAIPYLSMAGIGNARFFDDDPGIHRKYFDGFPVPVENMDDLMADPVTHLLILSFAFGDQIRSRINEQLPGYKIEIACLEDFNITQ